ncbi:hypothetical protein QYF36_019364 [Acer negundo]|nr:hypothetical protein QYF36_019364 [Acer negundo]
METLMAEIFVLFFFFCVLAEKTIRLLYIHINHKSPAISTARVLYNSSELPLPASMETDKQPIRKFEEEKMVKFGAVTSSQPPNVNHSIVPGFQRSVNCVRPPPISDFEDAVVAQKSKSCLGGVGKVVLTLLNLKLLHQRVNWDHPVMEDNSVEKGLEV